VPSERASIAFDDPRLETPPVGKTAGGRGAGRKDRGAAAVALWRKSDMSSTSENRPSISDSLRDKLTATLASP